MNPRQPEIAVLSDIHLGTHACKAKKVLKYLKSISPGMLVLNGDIIDSWRFSRNYFPKTHLKVVRQLIRMLGKGVKIVYITGNHDEFLRRFSHMKLGNLSIVNQLVLELNGQKTWIFHGDIFDHVIHHARWLAKLGAAGYGLLSLINKAFNRILRLVGSKETFLYKKLKEKFVRSKPDSTEFEQAVCRMAATRGFRTVICGHTHNPQDKLMFHGPKSVRYLNCGDWLENFTATEYYNGCWHLCFFPEGKEPETIAEEPDIPGYREVYQSLYRELSMNLQ
ncbi:MAG: UDP-2,3-diacylglucosamine diphosphatase [Mangrovibacterium sp.]